MRPKHRSKDRLAAILTTVFLGYAITAPASALGTRAPRPLAQNAAGQELPPGLNQAFTLAAGGDLAGAIAIVEALCAEDGAPEAAFGVLGGLHVEAGNPERALEVLAPLADREPGDPAVLYNAGRAAEGLGRFPEADAYYRRSLAIQPRSPALRSLGMMIGRFGRPDVAYEFLGPWIEANPADHEARIAAAVGAIALERAPEAEALLQGLPGNDPGVKLLRAQVLLQRSDPWGAINELGSLETAPPPALDGAIRRTLARAYLVVGEAEGALEQMEPLQGGGSEDAIILAGAYFQAGQLDEAITTLAPHAEPMADASSSDELPPAAGHLALEYGRYLHSAGQAVRAVPFLRLATDLNPDTPAAFQALGQALAAAGEREQARQALERFQELSEQTVNELVALDLQQRDVDDPTGREVRKALELSATGDVDGALALLRNEAGLAPSDPRPAYAASSVLLHAGRPEEALAVADEALAISPGGADGLYQRGAVLMSLQRMDEAEDMFRQVLAAYPEHTATLSDYAVLLMSEGRNDDAARHLESVLELRPGDALAHQHLERLRGTVQPAENTPENWAKIGRDLVGDQDYKAAEEPLRRAVALDPENVGLRIELALALWENNLPSEAEQHAREAIAMAPSSGGTHRILGALLLWRGDYLEAAMSLDRAAALAEPGVALLLDLGRAWDGAARDAAGSPEEEMLLRRAEAAYRQATTLAPEHVEAVYGLAQVLPRLGNEEEASAQMARYLELYRSQQAERRERSIDALRPEQRSPIQ